MPNEDSKNPVEAALEWLGGVADDLGLADDERSQFVDAGMKRKGFVQKSSWDMPEPDPNEKNGGGDFFSVKRGERETREVKGGGTGRNWQYGERSG